MKKVIKYFFVFLFSAFIMLLVSNTDVSANYDPSKNYTSVSVSKEGVRIEVTYQRGFQSQKGNDTDALTATYIWCESDSNFTSSSAKRCTPSANSDNVVNFVEKSSNTLSSYIVKGPSSYSDNNPTKVSFYVSKQDDPILNNLGYYANKYYIIYVTTYFCKVRDPNSKNANGDFTSCLAWDTSDEQKYTKLQININEFSSKSTISTEIPEQDISNLMQKITEIVYTIVLPVIWALLGALLVVRGAILGIKIIKAADEPQVRQEKIGALKWLVIGVAIAYGTTGVIKLLENVIKNAVGIGD